MGVVGAGGITGVGDHSQLVQRDKHQSSGPEIE